MELLIFKKGRDTVGACFIFVHDYIKQTDIGIISL